MVYYDKKLKKAEKDLAKFNAKEIATEINRISKEIDRYMKSTKSAPNSHPSGVESTDYYKEKVDEYYRLYMNFPPKEEKTLSDLATDTTLDLHPGDY